MVKVKNTSREDQYFPGLPVFKAGEERNVVLDQFLVLERSPHIQEVKKEKKKNILKTND